jgi:hypothetical protein
VERAQRIDPDFSWREAAPALTLLVAIALIALVGWVLLHRLSGTRPVPGTGRVQKRQANAVVALRPRAAMSVLVLNGNGMPGAAGGLASRLLADGYRSAPATNAQVTTYARSVVLFRAGWERAAKRLGKDARIQTVAPLDGALPAGYARYPLVVIVGR